MNFTRLSRIWRIDVFVVAIFRCMIRHRCLCEEPMRWLWTQMVCENVMSQYTVQATREHTAKTDQTQNEVIHGYEFDVASMCAQRCTRDEQLANSYRNCSNDVTPWKLNYRICHSHYLLSSQLCWAKIDNRIVANVLETQWKFGFSFSIASTDCQKKIVKWREMKRIGSTFHNS